MFKIVEEKKIGGSSKIFLKKIAIEKKKLPKLRQNHDLQSNTSRWTDRQKCWNSGYYWSLMVDKCGNSHFIWFFIDLDKKSGSNSSKHRGGGIRPSPDYTLTKKPGLFRVKCFKLLTRLNYSHHADDVFSNIAKPYNSNYSGWMGMNKGLQIYFALNLRLRAWKGNAGQHSQFGLDGVKSGQIGCARIIICNVCFIHHRQHKPFKNYRNGVKSFVSAQFKAKTLQEPMHYKLYGFFM